MQLTIKHQDLYSRGELLLRTLFGFLYIMIPHAFLLCFLGIWSLLLGFIAFWAVLFTGRYPQSFFEFQVKLMNWTTRVQATVGNLVDGYPAFGLDVAGDNVSLSVEYPEHLNRGLVLLRLFFGWAYLLIPHGVCLMARFVATGILHFLAWWVVLFTGNFPASWHAFNTGTLRWGTRVHLYYGLMTDTYPPFSGKP